jgi:hypothetical protein
MGLTSFISKIKAISSSTKPRKQTSRNKEMNETRVHKFILFQPIPHHIDFIDVCSQEIVTKIQYNNAQKFQTQVLLVLLNQIIDHDRKLIPQIDFFVSKLEVGVFGKSLKFSIHMNQEWIVELLSPSFEEKCIASYFQFFHPMQTYMSKYKFYTNTNVICPVLKSVIVLAGYSSVSKPNPELQKYLKHLAIVQLKKNMFNIRVSVCQAMFIFSHYLLFQALGKQSLHYFNQGYLMASALGIHVDIPGLNELDKDERRWIRFTSQKLDTHLSIMVNFQPHYLFLGSSWTPLNPAYQTNPNSKDPNEFMIAECICLTNKCCNMYWTISANLISKYSQITLFNPEVFLKDNGAKAIYALQTLLNHSLIRTLDLHLNLSGKCKNSEELEIVKNFVKVHVRYYHNIKLTLSSQFSPESPTLGLDLNTKKQLWSAQALYQITLDPNPLFLPMFYQNLCFFSLFFIKLILNYGHIPHLNELFLEKFKQVYIVFNKYRSKYNMPSDLLEVIDIITTYYNIKI